MEVASREFLNQVGDYQMKNATKGSVRMVASIFTMVGSIFFVAIYKPVVAQWQQRATCIEDTNGTKCPQKGQCNFVLQVPYYCQITSNPFKCVSPWPNTNCRVDPVANTCGTKISCFDDEPITDESDEPVLCTETLNKCLAVETP